MLALVLVAFEGPLLSDDLVLSSDSFLSDGFFSALTLFRVFLLFPLPAILEISAGLETEGQLFSVVVAFGLFQFSVRHENPNSSMF